MTILPVVLALCFAVAFKVCNLNERYLQERGVPPLRTFALYRYALIPAIIWSIIFIRPEDINQLLHTPQLLAFLFFMAITWNIQMILTSYVINSINSMSAFTTLQHLIHLPLILLVGTYFNQDIPNIYSILAIVALLAAFILQPTPHVKNTRMKFSLPIVLIIGLVVLQASLDAANGGLYRELLKQIRPEVVIGAFSITTLGLTVLLVPFIPKKPKDTAVIRRKWKWAALIPILWFAGTVPEAYVFAALPLYTGVSIAALSFVMDAVSDLRQHRIHFNLRTAAFMLLVLGGVGLAVYSIS